MNFGVVGIPKDEAGARKVFEFAKKLGVRAITIEPSADQIDLIEKLIREYNIAAGIHSHPKRANKPDYKLWDPNYERDWENTVPDIAQCVGYVRGFADAENKP